MGPPPRTPPARDSGHGLVETRLSSPRHRCTRHASRQEFLSPFSAAPSIQACRVPFSRVAPGRGDRARICLLRRAGSPGTRWRRRRRRGDPRRREATSRERGRRSLTAPPRRSLWRKENRPSTFIGTRPQKGLPHLRSPLNHCASSDSEPLSKQLQKTGLAPRCLVFANILADAHRRSQVVEHVGELEQSTLVHAGLGT